MMRLKLHGKLLVCNIYLRIVENDLQASVCEDMTSKDRDRSDVIEKTTNQQQQQQQQQQQVRARLLYAIPYCSTTHPPKVAVFNEVQP